MSSYINQFDIRDQLDVEIHSMKPSWWMRYGILSAFAIVLVVLILAYIIQYPDTVYGEFRMLSSQPSITIPLPRNAQIDQVFKRNEDVLKKGDHILLFKNSTNYEDLVEIDELLSLKHTNDREFNALFEKIRYKSYSLGELQGAWTQLYDKLFEHYTITKTKRYDAKIKRLNDLLAKQNQLNEKINGLLLMDKKESNIMEKSLGTDSILYSDGILSEATYLLKKEQYIQKSKVQQQNEITLKKNELSTIDLMNSIQTVKEEKDENLLAVRFQITEIINKFRSDIYIWKKTYLVEAPINGRLNYLGNIDAMRYMLSDEYTIVLTPQDTDFKAMIKIPLLRAGKIAENQVVHLKLNDYPYREYGHLEGRLISVSNVAGSDYYLGQVNLGKKLETSYHKAILIKENMSGTAEIITNNRNVLERVLDKFLYIFRK